MTKITKIVTVVGLLIGVIGIFIMFENPDAGVVVSGLGVVSLSVYLIVLGILAMVKSAEARKKGLITIGYTLAVFAGVGVFIGVGIALDLEPWVGAVIFPILLVIVVFIVLVVKQVIEDPCPQCGQKFAFKGVPVDKKVLRKYATTVDVEKPIKNNKGEKIATYTVTVPATTFVCEYTDICKFCHTKRVRVQEHTYKD